MININLINDFPKASTKDDTLGYSVYAKHVSVRIPLSKNTIKSTNYKKHKNRCKFIVGLKQQKMLLISLNTSFIGICKKILVRISL